MYAFGEEDVAEEPYHYGSYEIYEADTEAQKYKFISYVNLTSKDSAQLWPQFMYESILKVATDDPEFEFKVRSTGYPLSLDIQNVEDTTDIGTVITFCALAFPMTIVYILLVV